MGFHHLHLNMTIQSSGLSVRTKDVLFALLTRDSFYAIGIFDHEVFAAPEMQKPLTEERKRLDEIYKKHSTLGLKSGDQYFKGLIMSSGHPDYIVRLADYYAGLILDLDAKLDDRFFINDLYDQGDLVKPNQFRMEWSLEHLDLGILDKKNNRLFRIHQSGI